MSLIEAASQYDKGGSVTFSAMLSSSLVLALVSLVTLTAIFWPKDKINTPEPVPHVQHSHRPLEELVSTVVSHGVDYFKNRDYQKARSRNYSRA